MGEGVVALSNHALGPLIESIHIQVLKGYDMDEILKGILVNTNGCGVHPMDIYHIAHVVFKYAKNVN